MCIYHCTKWLRPDMYSLVVMGTTKRGIIGPELTNFVSQNGVNYFVYI